MPKLNHWIRNWKIILVLVWLVFTLSLAAWWMIFSLQQNDQLQLFVDPSLNSKVVRQHTMLLWEGGILLVSLAGGGFALFYFILAEVRQNRRLKEFFATFSHEIKTSLTSLRLQAESLQEDLGDRPSTLLDRLTDDTVRLEIQLENSLFLANQGQRKLHIEKIRLSEVLKSFEHFWTGVTVKLDGDAELQGDIRALESIFKNLFYNSVHHGDASQITLSCRGEGGGRVRLSIVDNGKGFSGDVRRLGSLFVRHQSTSGSGLGLHLVRRLTSEMFGMVDFLESESGFHVSLSLPGRICQENGHE